MLIKNVLSGNVSKGVGLMTVVVIVAVAVLIVILTIMAGIWGGVSENSLPILQKIMSTGGSA